MRVPPSPLPGQAGQAHTKKVSFSLLLLKVSCKVSGLFVFPSLALPCHFLSGPEGMQRSGHLAASMRASEKEEEGQERLGD